MAIRNWEVVTHTNSILNSASYIIKNNEAGECWMVDCGDSSPILALSEGLNLEGIFLTHAHFDHIYGLNDIVKHHPEARIYTNEPGALMLVDEKRNMSKYHDSPFILSDKAIIEIIKDDMGVMLDENLCAKAFFTPGHNPSCITWMIGDWIFTGDSYIPGFKTVSNLPGGNKSDIIKSDKLIKELIVGKIVYPGHNL